MRLCVFDLDHTLIHSPLDLAAMALDMRGHLENLWQPLPARPERYRVGELIALCQAEAPHLEPDLWAIALDHERSAVGEASLEPGAMEAVHGVRAAGFRTALWTNNAREITLDALTRFGLDQLLDITVTRDEMRQLKPHPDGWRVICQLMGGLERAPQAPLRSGRPGQPGAPLDPTPRVRGLDRAPQAPLRSGRPGQPGAPLDPTPGARGLDSAPQARDGFADAVVVGDSWVDGAAAGAAGVPFIAYRTNPRDLERWKVTPIATITHLGDLPALLAKLREPG